MKKISYYVAAFALCCGVSQTLTSCIETEEPESVKAMREAEARRLDAETQKLLAEAAETNQKTDEAKAKQDLMVKAQEITNAVNQLALDKQKDSWDLTKADQLAADIANYQAAAKEAKRDNELNFLDSKLAQQVPNYNEYKQAAQELADAEKELADAADELANNLGLVKTAKLIELDLEKNILEEDANVANATKTQKDWQKQYDDAEADDPVYMFDLNGNVLNYSAKKDVPTLDLENCKAWLKYNISKCKKNQEMATLQLKAFKEKTYNGEDAANYTIAFGNAFQRWQDAVEDQATKQAKYNDEKADFEADFKAIKAAINKE
ncbi:MAG: hypothetical protein IKS00_04185 [Bacteroidales bacterium]|nr:hypothetical protein [Bacteroidales bacterium]